MKTVYIAHPFFGDGSRPPIENCATINNIARLITLKEPDVAVISPVNALSFLYCHDKKRRRHRARDMQTPAVPRRRAARVRRLAQLQRLLHGDRARP